VQGFAPTSRAARQLKEAGVEAGTLQGFLAQSAQPDAASERKHFYFVDESSLASTTQMREFLARLSATSRRPDAIFAGNVNICCLLFQMVNG